MTLTPGPFSADDAVVYRGDCVEVMAQMPESSIDDIVCDPPYELGFMGKKWDGQGIAYSVEMWGEVLRVLKPGGHVLAFGGTRTFHRMTVAMEDAGFEIRDCLAWMYGSGFPKSLDVSKAIDKAAPRAGMFAAFADHYIERRAAAGMTHAAVCAAVGAHGAVNHGGASVIWEKGYGVPTLAQWEVLAPLLDLSDEWLPLIEREEAERQVAGARSGSRLAVAPGQGEDRGATTLNITAPATEEAQRWEGWGTALKPAYEPIILARKPLIGTVASNVVTHGTGALNIEGCRIGTDGTLRPNGPIGYHGGGAGGTGGSESGRWPANVVLDEHAAAVLDAQTGELQSGTNAVRTQVGSFLEHGGLGRPGDVQTTYGDSGGASRFFYTSKASKADRGEGNLHPTVKPTDLMQWLVRLVTPPGGTVLDPFAGSGTTGVAAIIEGFPCILIEREAEYVEIIRRRLTEGNIQPSLLGGAA